MQPSTAQRRFALLLVLAQGILLALISSLPRRTHWPVPRALHLAGYLGIAVGAGLAAAGATELGRGLTALPLPNDRAQLRTGGLYRWVRHPIYSGLLIGAAARASTSGNKWALVGFLALAGLLTGKAHFEEPHAHAFPDTQNTQVAPRGSFHDLDFDATATPTPTRHATRIEPVRIGVGVTDIGGLNGRDARGGESRRCQ